MALRSFVLIAIAASILIVSCPADYTEASGSSEATASSTGASAKSSAVARSKASSSKKKKCIRVARCPVNEEYSFCIQSIGRAQYCAQYGQPLRCEDTSPSSCKQGCVCKEDYLRNINGTCIPARECKADCASTEVLDECPADCASDYCPTSNAEVPTCERPDQDDCPDPVCKCRFNYRRAINGSCIPTRDCPPFDCSALPYEEFNPCPPLCPTDDCSQASPTGECPLKFGRIGIILECQPKCRCIKGYWRKDGICVPYSKCPKSCPLNEEYVTCIQGVCRAMNCSQKGEDVPCPDRDWPEEQCDAGCICKENFLRAENGTCVPENQCDNNTNVCPPNEEYSECKQILCRAQNCTQKGKPVPCPSIDEESCIEGCVCQEGYLRLENGTCVPQDDCDSTDDLPTCNDNEVLDNCPSDCKSDYCPTCEEDSNEQCSLPDPCPPPACKCKFNHRRDSTGVCIPTENCPPFECERPDEVFVACPPICPSDACGQPRLTGRCPFKIGIRLICNPKCQCKDGYGRVNDTCIPFEKCPNLCPKNEEYNSCTQAVCRPQQCSNREGPVACPSVDKESCKRGCICKEGYFRNDNGTCVTAKDCEPLCPNENEEYTVSQKPNCPILDTCTSIVAKIICTEPEVAGCTCKDGYLRLNKTSPCVPVCECPEMANALQCQKEPVCPNENEEYTVSRTPNCPMLDTCISIVARINCKEPEVPGCTCKGGYLRLNTTSPCIPLCECPQMANSPDCQTGPLCPYPNEEYTISQRPNCPILDTCRSIVSRVDCQEPKVPGCTCKSGYFRLDTTSHCIPICDCPEMKDTEECQ